MRSHRWLAIAACATVAGCNQSPVSNTAVACQQRPSDQRILTALNTTGDSNIRLLGVHVECNNANVLYQRPSGKFVTVALLATDNGKWFFVYGNAFSGTTIVEVN